MEELQKVVMPLVAPAEKVLNRGLDNVYINTALKVFIGLYAAFAAPKLPPSLVNLTDNVLSESDLHLLLYLWLLEIHQLQ